MKTKDHCDKCGAPLPADAPRGICPRCMMQDALEATAQSPPTHSSSTHPVPSRSSNRGAEIGGKLRYFGDYELLEKIAQGGMGIVYKARQVKLNRIVAVKMILGGQLATEADIQRFLTEAEAAANLQHPNIVSIHEVGEHEEQHYFSMDYVEGSNLSGFTRDNPLPAAQTAQITRTLADAIHYAHQRGTLHRDLKPSNVLIDAQGQPRITDFGLAKQSARENGLTQTGAVMGSPAYMPPEQAAGKNEEVGPASDVYSLGAILYYLLTGRAPFVAETPLATLRKVVEEAPPAPSKLNSKTPPDLETICLKCLEKRPERRYHSARELAEELGRFLNHEPIFARPASAWRKVWSWWQRNPWAIIGLAAAAGIVLLGVAYGLWEQIQFLQWKSVHSAADKPEVYLKLGDLNDPTLISIIGYLIMAPALFLGRWLTGRQQRNLPASNLQLAILAAGGLLLIVLGSWFDLSLIRGFVWTNRFSWHVLVGLCLGSPLIFCWTGGILIWQAVRRHQAHWSGSAAVEVDWLPRQSLRYSSGAFIAATLVNLALFTFLAYLTVLTAPFDALFQYSGRTAAAYTWVRVGFVFIAFLVSYACWVFATRKVQKRPALVSLFIWVLYGGSALVWFSVMPATFVIPAVLAGLAGGLVFMKLVKFRSVEPAEPLPPLVLGELFQWDRRALALALAVVVLALGLLAGLFFQKDSFMFLFLTVWTALCPALLMAARATTGRFREFFLSLLVAICFVVVGFPIGALSSEFKSAVILHWLAITVVGISAGCALIYFGKIRPKTS